MDEYYANIAREVLSGAHSKLINAQDYLTMAQAPDFLQERIKRQISALRNLQDEINSLEQLAHENNQQKC